MTKLTPAEKIDRIWREACDNQRKLRSCPRHLFDFAAYTHTLAVMHVPCVRCSGRQKVELALSYIEGFIVGCGDMSDVAINVTVAIGAGERTCPGCDGKNRKPYPGAWSGVNCPLCGGVGSVGHGQAASFLSKRN